MHAATSTSAPPNVLTSMAFAVPRAGDAALVSHMGTQGAHRRVDASVGALNVLGIYVSDALQSMKDEDNQFEDKHSANSLHVPSLLIMMIAV
jgi:hypothetical protein